MNMLPGDNESKYRTWHQKQADAIDQYVDRMRKDGYRFSYFRGIYEWESVSDSILQNAENGGCADFNIEQAHQILQNGTLNGIRIDIDNFYRWSGVWDLDSFDEGIDLNSAEQAYYRRVFYANLAINHSELFDALTSQDVVGLHGTQSIVLPSIIAVGGLLSHARQHDLGVLTGSGEEHPLPLRREFVSFGSVSDLVGINYAAMDIRSSTSTSSLESAAYLYEGYRLRVDEINNFNNRLFQSINEGDEFLRYAELHRFGVTLGLSRRAIWSAGMNDTVGGCIQILSSFDELGFKDNVGQEYLPVAFVPEQHLDIVQDHFDSVPMSFMSSELLSDAQKEAWKIFRRQN